MWLDLSKIIEIPGAEVAFETELDAENLDFPSIAAFEAAPKAKGKIVNSAGLLTLRGELDVDMNCICDRCGITYPRTKHMELAVPLAADLEDDDNPDVYPVEGDGVDVNEILETVFILNMEAKSLCSEDCKGLCPDCGKNLNEGPCNCGKKVDPRLAVLGQLLDIDENQ